MKMKRMIFKLLTQADFPLLLKWLESPHVKMWWDSDVHWTSELIQEKYQTYVNGYKIEQGERKKIEAYIVYADDTPIGYIQLYNAYDFVRAVPLVGLPASLAAFDMFIGEKEYLGKGIGSHILATFIEQFCTNKYAYVFADPAIENKQAIRAYEKVGFEIVKENSESGEVWMLYVVPEGKN